MARDAGVRRLVLTHMGPHISTPAVLEHWLGRIRKIFNGEIVAGRELETVELAG
jgi:ribonuclease BN (tRNA processing enzyme)